jgi:hypothetical protein
MKMIKTTHDAHASWVVFNRNRICRISPLPYDFLSFLSATNREKPDAPLLSRSIQQNCPLVE